MKTSEVRKTAFRIAIEIYENASGNLKFQTFLISDYASQLGLLGDDAIKAVERYLSSVGIMEHPYLGDDSMQFTPFGISVIEQSIDQPTEGHGPFPPMSVVIGDVQAGAQIAIGSGSFTQTSNVQQAELDLTQLSTLVEAALQRWQPDQQKQGAGSAALIAGEISSPSPDLDLIKAAATKLSKIAVNVGEKVATPLLLAYLKSHGFMS